MFQRIEVALASPVREVVIDALTAVSIASGRIGVEAPDGEKDDLIGVMEPVSQMLWWRRQPGLQGAIAVVRVVTTRHPWSFSGTVERAVLEGLRHMIADTAIRAPRESHLNPEYEGPDTSTKLMVRPSSSSLGVHAISTLFETRRSFTRCDRGLEVRMPV